MINLIASLLIIMIIMRILASWKGSKPREKLYAILLLTFLLMGLLSFLDPA